MKSANGSTIAQTAFAAGAAFALSSASGYAGGDFFMYTPTEPSKTTQNLLPTLPVCLEEEKTF